VCGCVSQLHSLTCIPPPYAATVKQETVFVCGCVSQLHSPAVEAAARAQKARLRSLFPQLMPDDDDEEEEGPGLLQWAYACVRSRAFFLGGDYFAYIPFLDMANHGNIPTAAYRPTGLSAELLKVHAAHEVAVAKRG
jgi:hypothetical protein